MRRLPPGPHNAALQTIRYAMGPYAFYASCAAKFGDLFTVPTLLGSLVVAGSPDSVRDIFSADADHFARWSTDSVTPLLGENALTLTSGEQHRRDRKLLMPPFHGARMRAYGTAMSKASRTESDRWQDARPFSILKAVQSISLDIIFHAVFGVDDGEQIKAFRTSIADATHALSPLIMLFKFMRRDFGGVGPWADFTRAREIVDRLTFREIATRRASNQPREDILSLMMSARYDDGSSMSDQELRDQLLTLVFAGHETTGIALAWALYWIDRDPAVAKKLTDELASLGPNPEPEALANSSYLGAICDETLRLHPIIPEVIRLVIKPLEVQGFTVPAGVAVAACTTVLHQRSELYPNPTVFLPERFLSRKYSPFEYIPFGGGSRRCIGAAFALYQMKIVLGTLLSRYRIRFVDSHRVRPTLRNLTMGPSSKVQVIATRLGS